jgi:hypothetical protein
MNRRDTPENTSTHASGIGLMSQLGCEATSVVSSKTGGRRPRCGSGGFRFHHTEVVCSSMESENLLSSRKGEAAYQLSRIPNLSVRGS